MLATPGIITLIGTLIGEREIAIPYEMKLGKFYPSKVVVFLRDGSEVPGATAELLATITLANHETVNYAAMFKTPISRLGNSFTIPIYQRRWLVDLAEDTCEINTNICFTIPLEMNDGIHKIRFPDDIIGLDLVNDAIRSILCEAGRGL